MSPVWAITSMKVSKESERLSRAPIVSMLLLASAMVVAIGLLSFQSSDSRRTAASEANVSRQIRNDTDDLLLLLADAESAQRGYLLTGNDSYLQPYQTAVTAVPIVIERLKSEAAGRPNQAERIAALQPAVTAKLQELAGTIEVRRSQGQPAALKMVDSGRGKALMDDIRARCTIILDISDRRTANFAALAEQSARRLSLVSTVGSLILLGLLAVSALMILAGLTQREKLYHQAAANAEFLRVTLNSIGDAVIATDAAARITLINPMAQKLTGWFEKDAIGAPITNIFRIVNETTRAAVENPVEKAIAKGTITTLANHTVLIARNGQEVPVDDSGAPICGPKGDIQGGVLVFRDISARRQAERQLRESNEQLKEFVAGAAHDLRAPLNSVNTMAQLIALRLQDQLDGNSREFLGYIIKGTQRMLHLLEDLLAYAQASHFEPRQARGVPMNRALQEALENLRAEIEKTHATVTAGALPEVAVHQAHLVQLFQNLVGNALKYRSETVPSIRIACARQGGEYIVQVADNGIGIDPQYEQQIFKPFKRLHGEDLPGSGIGLATCQKIVSGYGGRIWLESQPGKGSTFFFSLPAGAATPAESVTHA
jgi:PAS domain S-box-containing protein